MSKNEKYIPALSFGWLTPFYDPLIRWVMHEDQLKKALVGQAKIQAGHKVLDLGCGTATLTILIKQTSPKADVSGLDGDPEVLAIGRKKAVQAGVSILLDQGMSFDLPYTDRSFDRILSSLLFHHLTTENKLRTLGEAYRVLKPGGQLHLADFGRPRTTWARWVSGLFDRLEEVPIITKDFCQR